MRPPVRKALIAGVSAVLLSLPAAACAHPMGTFSINHYAAITAATDTLSIRYLIDFAEVPSVSLLPLLDPDDDDRITPGEKRAFLDSLAPAIEEGIELSVNGVPLPLERGFRNVHVIEGEGGLGTVVIGLDWIAPIADSLRTTMLLAEYRDNNYPHRTGWKEIRIDTKGTTLLRCSVDPGDPTDGLTRYPEQYTDDPPDEIEARFYFGAGEPPAPPAALERHGEEDRFSSLIRVGESPRLMLGALALALLLGAIHALEPGHGKTLVAAYLVGSRGTIAQAILLGLVVTITHTLSVFILGAITLYASRSFVPEQIFPWLSFFSGLLVLIIGLSLLRRTIGLFRRPGHSHGHGGHDDHDHDHHHHHGHHHHAPAGERTSLASLLTLGITGGIVPCPSALVVLLAAVSLGRVGFGLALIVAFSAGLALVLVAIGTLFVVARPLLERSLPRLGAFRWLRLLSSSAIVLIGLAILIRSFAA